MRYFLNTSAAKPTVAGGVTFAFEPVGLRGGSWLGVLAVEDPAASILADSHSPNVEEIPFDTYDSIKKKLTNSEPITNASRTPPDQPPNPSLAIASRAGLPTDPTIARPPAPNSTEMVTPITLLTTRNQPPDEPMIAAGASMRRPK